MNPHIAELISDEDRKIIEKGIRCEALFSNPVFAEVVNALSDEFANELLSTEVHESKKRESLFMRHFALNEIVEHIKEAIRVRMETEHRLKAEAPTLSEPNKYDEGNF